MYDLVVTITTTILNKNDLKTMEEICIVHNCTVCPTIILVQLEFFIYFHGLKLEIFFFKFESQDWSFKILNFSLVFKKKVWTHCTT